MVQDFVGTFPGRFDGLAFERRAFILHGHPVILIDHQVFDDGLEFTHVHAAKNDFGPCAVLDRGEEPGIFLTQLELARELIRKHDIQAEFAPEFQRGREIHRAVLWGFVEQEDGERTLLLRCSEFVREDAVQNKPKHCPRVVWDERIEK